MDGTRSELLENFRRKEFIKDHLMNYSQMIKEIYPESRFVLNPKLILDRYDVFLSIMKMIESGDLQKIYDSVSEKEFEDIYKRIESQIFKD